MALGAPEPLCNLQEVVQQEPEKHKMREKEHRIIREYIYNWKTSLENAQKKAKDHVLEEFSYTMEQKFEELKVLRQFDTMLKSTNDDFEGELSKVIGICISLNSLKLL